MASNSRPNWFTKAVERKQISNDNFDPKKNIGQFPSPFRMANLKKLHIQRQKKSKFEYNIDPLTPITQLSLNLTGHEKTIIKNIPFMDALNTPCGLSPGESIGKAFIQDYPIYTIQQGPTQTGIRKIAHEDDPRFLIGGIAQGQGPAYLNGTRKEQSVYDELLKITNHTKYLLPVRKPSTGWCNENGYAIIDFDYLPGNSVTEYIQKTHTDNNLNILLGVTDAILWLVENNFIHGDITTGNFFVVKNDGKSFDIRVLDFSNTTRYDTSKITNTDHIFLNEIKPVMGKNGLLNLLKGCMCPEDVIISIMTIHECSMRDFFKRAFTILKEELSRSRNGSKSSTATYLGGNRTRTRRLRRRNRVSSYRRRQRTR